MVIAKLMSHKIILCLFWKGSLTEGLGKKHLSEINNLVPCQVEERRMQYLR